jgi:hypothetical protein
MRVLFAVIFFGCTAASAQMPGLGETRPRAPEPEKQQVDKSGKTEAPRSATRCSELSGAAREDCLREEKSVSGENPAPATGATRRPEPPTAPPPQNPR